MHIYIPSMQRASMQYTLEAIKEESPYPITLVVPAEELDDYTVANPGVGIIGTNCKGIANTRDWIMAIASRDEEHVLMMDDDLTFYARRNDDPTKFRNLDKGEIREMLTSVHALLHKYVHVGIAPREGANRNISPVLSCTRAPRVIGYRMAEFFESGASFANSTVMDDFEVTLHLLTRGYENGILNSFVQNQRGSGTVGGASTYRTLEVHAAAAKKLAERYPQFVKTVEKTTARAWGGATRTDVIIQWKRALEYGKATNG